AAIRALGAPNKITVQGSNTCTGTWSGLGLRILFTSFGGGSGCRTVFAQTGMISGEAGRRHWRTARGLRVGDSLGKLARLYPGAITERGARAIAYNLHSPLTGGRVDVVTAVLAGNRVAS